MTLLTELLGPQRQVLKPQGGCATCPRNLRGYVPGILSDKKVLVVSEAPYADDVAEGVPLSGHYGQMVRRGLAGAGIHDFAITTLIHCQPDPGKSPTDREISCCLNQYVMAEVTGYSMVVLVGSLVSNAFLPGGSKAVRGNVVHHPDFPGQRFFPIFHPAYIAKNSRFEGVWSSHFVRLQRVMHEDGTPPWQTTAGDSPHLLAKIRSILATRRFSFDIETNGLYPHEPSQCIKSFSLCATATYVVFVHEEDTQWEAALRLVGEALENPGNTMIAHSAGFEAVWMEYALGITYRAKTADTQCLFYLLKQTKMASLKVMTNQHLDGYRYLIVNPHLCTDVTLLALYNAEDVVRTLQLFDRFYPQMNPTQQDLFWRVSCPSGVALKRCSSAGFGYDVDAAVILDTKLGMEREGILREWKAAYPNFQQDNHLSGDGLADWLYEINGLTWGRVSDKTGKPSTDINEIVRLKQQNPGLDYLDWLARIRGIDKRRGTYLKKFITGEHLHSDGRVHSEFTSTWTDTGRSSSRKPNAQNVPRDPEQRNLFIPSPGNILLQGDFSQIELRIAMCLARDASGILAYQQGLDLHGITGAKMAAHAGRSEMTSDDRTNAKPVNFGLIYGGDYGTLQRYALQTYGTVISEEDAKEYVNVFFQTYRMLRPWHRKTIELLGENRGYQESILGHTTKYRDYNSESQGAKDHAHNAAINMTCQSPASYMTLYTLWLIQQKIKETDLIATTISTVHDSIMVDLPPSEVGAVVKIMQDSVEECRLWIADWFVTPLVMDFEVGRAWGSLQKFNT